VSNSPPGPPLAHYASVAHVARVYDYLLGGKDNFAADRGAAEQAMRINPAVVPTAHANRAFLARATRYLTAEAELGLVRAPEWRPALAIDAAAPAQMWAGVAIKP
jgi:S-adenosyl methyltransferase